MSSSDDAARNRELWTKSNADHTGPSARRHWAAEEITWGIFGVPEADRVRAAGARREGCGRARLRHRVLLGPAWHGVARALSGSTSRRPSSRPRGQMQQEFGLEFPLIEADAAETGPARRFADLVVSEYGASIWVDPYRWIPEAARLPPAGRRARLPAQLDARRSSARPDGGTSRPASSSSGRCSGCTVSTGGTADRVPPRPRRLDPAPASQRLRHPRPRRASGATGRRDGRVLRLCHRRLGARTGRAEEIWKARKR